MKIALDAMGGDHAPATLVEGAVLATQELGAEIILVGDKEILQQTLSHYPSAAPSISIVHAPQRVEMDESPSLVIRKKRQSSIWIATELVKNKEAIAVISAGNTGASMATALFILGPISGVERPAIATPLPTLRGTSLLIDVGANVDCKPQQLFQFAVMGQVYAEDVMGVSKPRVGLLSIGEEDAKGNELTKETFKMLKASTLNFIGNVEGRDVYTGHADVIVCDGFIGNVVLKVSEGLAEAIIQFLKREIMVSPIAKLGAFLLKPAFRRFRRKIDYAEYGGAPLLGVDGISIICHGRSSAKAIRNAIRLAMESFQHGLNDHIKDRIATQITPINGRKSS